MITIEKLLISVSCGVGDRCGCSDNNKKRADNWIKRSLLSGLNEKKDDEELLREIRNVVGYGD